MTSPAPAAAQALALLQLLGRRGGPQPAARLAHELGLPRSTTYKLLGVLEEAGFVAHSPATRRWGLGVSAYELGSAYSRQQPLQRVARGVMTALAEETGHCAHLAVLHGTDVLYVIEERPLERAPLVSDVGVRLPAAVTASGLAMLAALPPAQIRALYPSADVLVQRHPGSPTTLPGLRSELARTRQRGFASEHGTVTPGFSSAACVVRDLNGLPVASVAITWPTAEVDGDDAATSLTEAVRSSATGIEHRLGVR